MMQAIKSVWHNGYSGSIYIVKLAPSCEQQQKIRISPLTYSCSRRLMILLFDCLLLNNDVRLDCRLIAHTQYERMRGWTVVGSLAFGGTFCSLFALKSDCAYVFAFAQLLFAFGCSGRVRGGVRFAHIPPIRLSAQRPLRHAIWLLPSRTTMRLAACVLLYGLLIWALCPQLYDDSTTIGISRHRTPWSRIYDVNNTFLFRFGNSFGR